MRLLNTTSIEIEQFNSNIPPYAILSHRWEDHEVTLEDMMPGGEGKGRDGYRKLRLSCAMASRQGLQYIWIDTCCIDKRSSAELSEAINSMFRYYREAEVCYAYLSDVASAKVPAHKMSKASDFFQSAWFRRGWTLQELIAPKNLQFYNKEWDYLGTKAELKTMLLLITKVPEKILLGGDLTDLSVSRKMSWVSSRQTSIPEDIAYCLLGIFSVNMPLLYGEGAENAFLRLQEAILKSIDDSSIFLWRSTEAEVLQQPFWGLLAKSPKYFASSPNTEAPCTAMMVTTTPAALTGRGVNVEFLLAPIPDDVSRSIYAALIFEEGRKQPHGLLLQKLSYSGTQFARVSADTLLEIDKSWVFNSAELIHRLGSASPISSGPPGAPINSRIGDPQPVRFYVRQDPKPSLLTSDEAIGFYLDSEQSLPLGTTVEDWSSRWERVEGGMFTDSGASFVLEFKEDGQLQSPKTLTTIPGWKSELCGVLQLSQELDGASRRVALCLGMQQTSLNLINTPLPQRAPWGLTFDLSVSEHNPDKVLRNFSSPKSKLSEELSSIQLNGGYKSPQLAASFEPRMVYGEVYYLVKIKLKGLISLARTSKTEASSNSRRY